MATNEQTTGHSVDGERKLFIKDTTFTITKRTAADIFNTKEPTRLNWPVRCHTCAWPSREVSLECTQIYNSKCSTAMATETTADGCG